MLDILKVTLPLFMLIALGFACVRSEFLPSNMLPALGGFVAKIALPALLFRTLAGHSLAEVAHLRFVFAYGLGSLCVFGAVVLLALRVQKLNLEQAAVRGMGSACSNSGFFGYPVALQVVGPIAGLALALAMLIENLVMIPLSLALAESHGQSDRHLLQTFGGALRQLARNPMVVAIFGGFAMVLLQLQLPPTVDRAVGMLSSASAPVALFYLGGNLVGLQPRGDMLRQVGLVSSGKLLLHPLGVYLAMRALGTTDPQLVEAGVLLAASPMLSIYAVLGQRHGAAVFCSCAQLITTLVAIVTVSGAIALVHNGRLFASIH